jgi:hypothetical protein
LQRKFNILVRKVELWHTTEIRDVVEACIMLHNWMVTIRIEHDKIKSEEWYNPSNEDYDVDDRFVEIEADAFQWRHVNQQQHSTIFNAFYEGNAVNFSGDVDRVRDMLPTRYQLVQERWKTLHTFSQYHRLRQVIVTKVTTNSDAFCSEFSLDI